jgi:hydrogenase maturation protease
MTPRTLILGYGNPLRGDDGLGWYAAERLAAILHEREVQTIALHQLTPDLAEPISRTGLVIFIDAEQGEPAGRVFCRRISPEGPLAGSFSHHLTPPALLAWTRGLYGYSPAALLFTVSGRSFDCSEELSPPVAAALPELVERVVSLARARGTAASPPQTGAR